MNLERITAIAQEAVSPELRYRHCAFIYDGSRLVTFAINQRKTHPLVKKYGYKDSADLHAELAAVIKHGSVDCTGLVLVVVRVRKTGSLAMSKPCTHCQEMLEALSFKEVWYSTSDGILVQL